MLKLKALATGIGSLPHKDADSALDLIFKYCPQIPFWPQLPKRNVREGMVVQFSEGLPCIKVDDKGIFFKSEDKEKELEKFYEKIINQDIEYFKISRDFALGLYTFHQRLKSDQKVIKDIEFIKCQITGPFTFAASINDEAGVALLHDAVFMQAITQGLTRKALWQIRFFEKFGKKIIIFIDEPYLGCFGSAYTPINRDDVVAALSELTGELRSKADTVLIGVHCCGNTDWSIFTDIKTINIISFDAFSFLDKMVLYSQELKKFFEQGRALCWGIVPTQEFSGQETPEMLIKKINDGIENLVKKGVSRDLLLQDIYLSPACGLGTLDTQKSEQIFKLLSELSYHIRTHR